MDIQQATLLETLTLYADKTQQQRDIDKQRAKNLSPLLRPQSEWQPLPNVSNRIHKELHVWLRAKEQGDDTPLPAFQGMRLINWLSAVAWAGD